ncbi:MAG: hypothetical protein IJK43_10800 [Prevotella sp.]|nr:hypothetical protein [Prevotella sp.]
MTAIVGILNKRGIAIAADSASTLKNKIINTGNKMLRLSDRAPIAVMVVNNSSLAGIPWEVIIRWYRKESGQEEFKTMQEYISSFYAFVQNKVLSRSDIQDDKTIFHNEAISYLVYAGYGMNELRPSIQEYEIYGIDHRMLLAKKNKRYEVYSPDKEVMIYSEGQPDIVKAYIEGVIGKREESIVDSQVEILKDCMMGVFYEPVFSLNEEKLTETFKNVIERCKKESEEDWLKAIKKYSLQEMASLAENLIKATELHKKIADLEEQVGGLIDLAVITREDGFQWLNRKSWYEPSRGGQYGKFGI